MTQLEKEINQQPELLRNLLEKETPNIEELIRHLRKREIKYLFIAARGSSDNAAIYAKYLFGSKCRLPVALAPPSLFTIYGEPPVIKDSFTIGISQSGQSPDVVSIIQEAKKQGAFTAAITNRIDSPLANTSDFVLNCRAGEERSVAATKTYTSQLMILAILASLYSGKKKNFDELQRLPSFCEETLKNNDKMASMVARYRYMDVCAIIGRGYNYSTAFEISLKLKELSHVLAEPYSSADFMHGPFAIVEEGFPIMVICPKGLMYKEIIRLIQKLRENKAELIVISDEKEALDYGHTPIPIPTGIPEWLSPLITVLPGQLFALNLTLTKGLDPDKPRSLKKVTRTL